MPDYRRLISYIYAYEGEAKGRNIGFAKLEARNGQCKIQVSVRKVFAGGQDVGVYLLTGSSEILLGRIFLRGGSGEFRTTVPFHDIDGSGRGMDQCYGLTIHGADDTWRSYTTIWEDAVAQAAEVVLEDATAEKAEEREMEKIPPAEIADQENSKMKQCAPEPAVLEIEREIREQEAEEASSQRIRIEEIQSESGQLPQTAASETCVQRSAEAPQSSAASETFVQRSAEAPQLFPAPQSSAASETCAQRSAEAPQLSPAQQISSAVSETSGQRSAEAPQLQSSAVSELSVQRSAEAPQLFPEQQSSAASETCVQRSAEAPQSSAASETSGQLSPAQQMPSAGQNEQPDLEDTEKLWAFFQRRYPKIQAFDYSGGCEILLIKPQDIGLLPRETWGYGNNSFLLHGYYNYRYLILARLSGQKGDIRFLLGVPGHYYSNEKYMASMFGFPNFVLSKMQPAGDGRFGYWYTDLRLAGRQPAAAK